MAQLTRAQWIKAAAGTVALLRKHGTDVADLASDVPKAIGLVHDIVSLMQDVQSPVVVEATPPVKEAQPVVPSTVHKVAAHHVAHEIAKDGLTPQEKVMFDHASQAGG